MNVNSQLVSRPMRIDPVARAMKDGEIKMTAASKGSRCLSAGVCHPSIPGFICLYGHWGRHSVTLFEEPLGMPGVLGVVVYS